jgi:predicted nuclease with TOPRIM domain
MRRLHVWWVIFVAVIFVGASGSQTFSQTLVDKDIEQRLTNQTNRVTEGVKSKQLTQEEAKILQDNLSSIRKEGVLLQGDGKITAEEKTQLNKLLDQNNHMIQDKKQYPIKAIAVPTTAAPAVATPATPTPAAQDPEIKEKIASQQKRIDEGIKSQQFTLNESKTLQSNLDQIREEDTSLRADGTLSKEDKADLLEMLADNDPGTIC